MAQQLPIMKRQRLHVMNGGMEQTAQKDYVLKFLKHLIKISFLHPTRPTIARAARTLSRPTCLTCPTIARPARTPILPAFPAFSAFSALPAFPILPEKINTFY